MARKRGGGFGQGQHRTYKSSSSKKAIELHVLKMVKENVRLANLLVQEEYERTLREVENRIARKKGERVDG